MDANRVMEDPSGSLAVAWYWWKSLPNGGENIFLAGHLEQGGSAAVFWNLRHLETGDRVIIAVGGVEFHYSVTSKDFVSKAESLHSVNDPVGSEVVTMMTCAGVWDPGTNDYTHRWIVRAARIN